MQLIFVSPNCDAQLLMSRRKRFACLGAGSSLQSCCRYRKLFKGFLQKIPLAHGTGGRKPNGGINNWQDRLVFHLDPKYTLSGPRTGAKNLCRMRLIPVCFLSRFCYMSFPYINGNSFVVLL